jgi:hypothetical protein
MTTSIVMKGKLTTNLTNLTNGIPSHRSAYGELVLDFAVRPEVDKQAQPISSCCQAFKDLSRFPLFLTVLSADS